MTVNGSMFVLYDMYFIYIHLVFSLYYECVLFLHRMILIMRFIVDISIFSFYIGNIKNITHDLNYLSYLSYLGNTF